jgi:acyl-CoA thioesterase
VDRAARITELLAGDALAASLGIELVAAEPVTVRLAVTRDHLNFRDTTHGGVVHAVAHAAFRLAAMAPGDTVEMIDAHLALSATTTTGDVLTAVAEEMTRGRTLATYRVTVRRSDGRTSALLSATARLGRSG